jgi:hypothetical protein
MRHSLPETYPSGECVLLAVDRDLLPVITSQLLPLLQARLWSQDSYEIGYRAISEVFSQMTAACMTGLIQEIRDFRGVKPEFEATPIDERTSDMYNSLNDSYAKLLELRGIMDDGWFTDTYTTLKDVVQVTRGLDITNAESMWDTISGLLTSSASIGDIVTNVAGLLTDTTETAVEGGLLTALIAIQAASIGVLSQQSTIQIELFNQLNLVLAALRGDTAPTDNILQAIRGDTVADATRNIIEELA